MDRRITIALAALAGIALGAAAVEGLHAQAKPKAYLVTESEVIDSTAQAAYVPQIQAALKAAGGHNFFTAGGKTIAYIGAAPKLVAISEWASSCAKTELSKTAVTRNPVSQYCHPS